MELTRRVALAGAAAAAIVTPAIAAKRPPPALPPSPRMRAFLAWLDTQPPSVRQYWATFSAIQNRIARDFAALRENGETQGFIVMRQAIEVRYPREHAAIVEYFAKEIP